MLDTDGRLIVDAPCVGCGYNLRTASLTGICPECSHPVAHSVQGYFLRFCPAQWVHNLARGLLHVLIAIGGSVVVGFLASLALAIPTLVSAAQNAGVPPSVPILAVSLVNFVVNAAFTTLGIIGLRLLTRREPANVGHPAGTKSRRVLRICSVLLPVPILLNLALALFIPSLPSFAPGSPPPSLTTVFGPRPAAFFAASIATGILSIAIYGVTVLALVRHVGALMARIPRLGLVRLARVVFWGLLAAGLVLSGGYAITVTTVLPAMSATIATATTMPSGGTAYYTSNTAVSVRSWPSGLQALGYATAPTSAPTTGPTSGPAVPAFATPGFFGGVMAGGCAAVLGGCGTLGFGIAAIVLLIMACVALFESARAAEQNAALASTST
jgi:hypothetical protein